MNDMTVKNQSPAIALAVLMLGGGGVNILSEGAEEKAIQELEDRLVNADIIQDQKYDDLLQLVNDMRIEVALLTQAMEEP